ncbi:MAG: hypothetical protein R3Y53_09610 [Bacillota bacterium]
MEFNQDTLPEEIYNKYTDILYGFQEVFSELDMDCDVLDDPEEVFIPAFSALISQKEGLDYFANIVIVPYQEEMLEENLLIQFATDLNIDVTKENKEHFRTAIETACSFAMMGNVSFVEVDKDLEHIQFKYAYPAPNMLTLPNAAVFEMFALFIAASVFFIDVFYDLEQGNITPEEACERLVSGDMDF